MAALGLNQYESKSNHKQVRETNSYRLYLEKEIVSNLMRIIFWIFFLESATDNIFLIK